MAVEGEVVPAYPVLGLPMPCLPPGRAASLGGHWERHFAQVQLIGLRWRDGPLQLKAGISERKEGEQVVIDHRNLLTIIWVLACVACTPPEVTSPLDAVLASGVETGRIPGVIAMAANSDGIIYQGASGVRDVASNTGMTVDTIVRIASMTKAVTSVAIMQLVEQGKIELDQPVSVYMPELTQVRVLEGFDADNMPILRAAKSPVTIRQLLTHTSGYVYDIWNENAARYATTGRGANTSDGRPDFTDVPLAFDPGSKWEYGISTDILGVLVEVVSGQSLDDYFREHIFAPLNMPDTYFIVPEGKCLALLPLTPSRNRGN